MYGETELVEIVRAFIRGLSPRVRGNLIITMRTQRMVRSIPACTGKPGVQVCGSRPIRVYPRVYGETSQLPRRLCCCLGLSPRVRGNRTVARAGLCGPGSIPACTGKPGHADQFRGFLEVYPRVYGETAVPAPIITAEPGLSPRVRGNLVDYPVLATGIRSIPACTGKPPVGSPKRAVLGVYPRVYGETVCGVESLRSSQGLSPRVRGNHSFTSTRLSMCRSIPACTGKPAGPRLSWCWTEVYPRVYGETRLGLKVRFLPEGLSPRVRGNRHNAVPPGPDPGSIPACTGKPPFDRAATNHYGVYPRVYGETPVGTFPQLQKGGLSPRVRGNLPHCRAGLAGMGSIPACTGKPRRRIAQGPSGRVYPRVYGETP